MIERLTVLSDTAYNLASSRTREVIANADAKDYEGRQPESTTGSDSGIRNIDKIHHFNAPTLPHLLVLLTHPTESFPPKDTSLIVVDCISTLFALAFPRSAEEFRDPQTPLKKSDTRQWVSGRRWAVLGDLASKLGRLAVTRNIAILLVSQTTTRVRLETGALLCPAISGTVWDSGINNRIIIFRDYLSKAKDASRQTGPQTGVRFAGIIKAKGIAYEGVGRVAAFIVLKVINLHQGSVGY